jgi:hypothetical protein
MAAGMPVRRFSLAAAHQKDICVPQQTPSDFHSSCDSPSGPCATARARWRTTNLRGASRPITPQPLRDTRWVPIRLGLPVVHYHEAHPQLLKGRMRRDANLIGRKVARLRYQQGLSQDLLVAKLQVLECGITRNAPPLDCHRHRD